MKERILENRQAIAICVTVMISHIILNLPNRLINQVSSSTILNFIYIFVIMLGFLWLVTKFFKVFPGYDVIDICEYVGGKIPKTIYSILIFLYLLVISSFVIRTFSDSLISIYFPSIDLEIIILIFISLTVLMNLLGFKSISRTCTILFPIIFTILIAVFVSSISAFTPERALPILGNGIKSTFFDGLSNIYAFSSALIITMLAPLINYENRMRKITFISFVLYGICVFIATISLLFLFPYSRRY